MESAIRPPLNEQVRSVIEVTPHMALLANIRNGSGLGACGYQKWAWRYNPGRCNAPGYQWVDESQAGWCRVMQ